MSSVRVKNRSTHRFTVTDKALDLYEHTTTVTANPLFAECKPLTDRINHEAMMIYHCCRSANEDLDAREKDEAKMRIELESEAVRHCKWLKTFIQLAKKKFHLRAKKIIFWNGLINDTMALIKAWKKSEEERYKENHGL